MTITVQYVSGVPGLGKTRAAVNFMAKHIRRGMRGVKGTGYIFYVAPTQALLRQTLGNLRALLDENEQRMIRAEYARSADKHTSTTATVDERIRAALDGRSTDTKAPLPFLPGSILFLTHAAFIKLRRHPKFKETTVIFDESRKWVTENMNMTFDEPTERLFHQLFDTEELVSVTGKKAQGLMTLRARSLPANRLASLVKMKGDARSFGTLVNIYDALRTGDDGPVRMQMFGSFRGHGSKRSFIGITLPSQPFVGFKSVMIMSADFENSQMYHLLKMEGCQVQNETDRFLNKHLPGGFGKAHSEVSARYEKLTIVPLLMDKAMPSKNQLDRGVIMPVEKLMPFKLKMEELGVTTEHLQDLVRAKRDPDVQKGILQPEQIELESYMREIGCEVDVFAWMVKSSNRLIKSWWKDNAPVKRDNVVQQGVVVVNKEYLSHAFNRKYYHHLSVGAVEGRNEFMHSNVVAFLAAINPPPLLDQLLTALLPDYDVAEDYVVDKAIQSLGRGNIRNHNTKKRMLAIVSTMGLAEKVRARMHNYPKIAVDTTEALGSMHRWSYNGATAQEKHEARVVNQAARSSRFAESMGDNIKLYRSLSAKIVRLNKKLERDPGNHEIEAEIALLKNRRAALKS
ncbi:hypothetical protein H1O16_gp381 [Burkholderia phage BcepSaruman]|uniref:Helicase n=1 Tax=Burkholderia phage BcepSaruman TaxID=2530032 RepID=A0A4D5ZCV6_9CAUD|nr:hypothetical protein H1O16_gp381 [Burkholderia phage BcepSaruman]QBX06794.1 hypothetical protein BcepSaruman_381 [Burkholderia phage BcepSaruman]